MKNLISFLSSKAFYANLVLACLFFITLFIILNLWLDSTTNHQQTVTVPDLTGLPFNEAQHILSNQNLDGKIIDSSEFNPEIPLGSVVAQFPREGDEVKENRVIMLTINPFTVRKTPLPDIIEKPLRRAVYDIKSKGFIVGELTYQPDIAKDVVLKILVNGEEYEPGEKFIKGTQIDLVVAGGLSNERVPVPYLKFKNLEEAKLKLKSKSLNVGLVIYDEDVQDSAHAQVYIQKPTASHKNVAKMGSFVDLWLTNDSTKIVNDSLQFMYPNIDIDSLQNHFETDTTTH